MIRYVSYWSDVDTWGGAFPPIEGDSVYIPKGLHLLMDIDSTPLLKFILCEGSFIILPHPTDPDHERYVNTNYILIRGGYMEVGTEENPYTSKIFITFFG